MFADTEQTDEEDRREEDEKNFKETHQRIRRHVLKALKRPPESKEKNRPHQAPHKKWQKNKPNVYLSQLFF